MKKLTLLPFLIFSFFSIFQANGQQIRIKDHLRIDISSTKFPVLYRYKNEGDDEYTIDTLSQENFIIYYQKGIEAYIEKLSVTPDDQLAYDQDEGGHKWKANYKWDDGKIFLDFYPYWSPERYGELRYPLAVTENELKNPGGEYYIDVPFRNALSVPRSSFAFGTLTIPFRLHTGGRNRDSNTLFSTGLNVGVYYGLRDGITTFYNSKYTDSERHSTVTLSMFSLFSGQTLKPSNTSDQYAVGQETFEPFYSQGVMLMGDFSGLQVLFAAGLDLPLTQNASQWDFSRRMWIGFGVGLSVFKY